MKAPAPRSPGPTGGSRRPGPAGRSARSFTHPVLVALGSNQGDSAEILCSALERIAGFSALPARRSSLWRSTPVDCPPGSPMFYNAAMSLVPKPGQTPESFLHELQAIERDFGRRPKNVFNEARPLDLDLIAWGAEVRATATLLLPHPRAHLRRFVLAPLAEIAPDFILPGQTQPVRTLLRHLRNDEKVERAGVGGSGDPGVSLGLKQR